MTSQQQADNLLSLWQLQRQLGIPANDRVFTIEPPYRRWRYPPGCPDSDWCSGNAVCFWDCQGDPDAGIECVSVSLGVFGHVRKRYTFFGHNGCVSVFLSEGGVRLRFVE